MNFSVLIERVESRVLFCIDGVHVGGEPDATPIAAHESAAATPVRGSDDAAVQRATSGWQSIAPLPLARTEAQQVGKDGRLYIFGGFFDDRWDATRRVDVFDPETSQWTRLPDMPVPITHAATAVDGDNAILIGGYVGDSPGPATRDVWMFNLRKNVWTRLPPLPQPRGAGGAGIVGTKLYFFGGANRTSSGSVETDHSNTWSLDLANLSRGWSARTGMPTPRNHLGYASLGNKLYAIGGQLRNREMTGNQSVVHSFNPATNRWSSVRSLPMTLGHIHAGDVVYDGQLVVAGGVTNGFTNTAKIHVFNPTSNSWSNPLNMPGPRKSLNLMIADNTLYYAGGGNNVATTSGYKIDWNSSRRISDLPADRTERASVFSNRAIELLQV